MHTQSIITVAIGAAGFANGMPAVDRRQIPGLSSLGLGGGSDNGQVSASAKGSGGSGFPFSLLKGIDGEGGGGEGGL